MLDSLPSEYVALIVYVAFVLLVFVGAVVWKAYRRDLKKKYFHYGDHQDDPATNEHTHTHTHM